MKMALKGDQENTISFDYHTLFFAVKNGNYKKVEQLLSKFHLTADKQLTDYKLLIYAVKYQNQLSIVELLVKKGCRVRVPKTNEFETPLCYAIANNKTRLLRFLLEAGASICDKDINTVTPLVLALKNKNLNAVDLMLSKYDVENINPNNVDEQIHFNIACMRNCVNLVKCFIEKGICVNNVQNWYLPKWSGYTPLHFAVENKSVNVVEILLKHGADYTKQNKNTLSSLHLAFDSEETRVKYKIMDLILDFHATNTINPVDSRKISHFHISCSRNNSKVVKAFLKSGVDINLPVTLPNASVGLSPLNLAVDFQQKEIVKILLHNGANVNCVDDTNSTSLHMAVEANDQEMTKILLDYGADPSIGNQEGISAIHIAYFNLPSSQEILDLLFSALPQQFKNTSDKSNFSIFHIACILNNIEVVKKMLQSNIDIDAQVKSKPKPPKWSGFTPLHFAAYFYNYDLTRLLLDFKANVNLKEVNGYTPLWLAVKFRFNDDIANKLNRCILFNKTSLSEAGVDEDEVMNFLSEEIKQIKIVQALVINKSDLNSVDVNRRPLLFEAWLPQVTWDLSDNIVNKSLIKSICSRFCDRNIKLTFKILVKHGINPEVTGKYKLSILDLVADSSKCSNAYLHIDKKFFESSQRTIMDLLTEKMRIKSAI